MKEARRQKRQRNNYAGRLELDGRPSADVWGRIIELLGPGHHLQVAGVSREWRSVYASVHGGSKRTSMKEMAWSVALLQWAYRNRCPRRLNLAQWAAENGRLEVVIWARDNGFPVNEATCAAAASGGHLAVLRWARANGIAWDEGTCTCAAGNAHLDVLRYARANGCPWSTWTCRNAALNGHQTVLQWAIANGCPLVD
eukprot:TRINITY_DN7645_c0_g1_i1.p1 TRINITY_DN7645_c0_g1~~TRINITY_DN7645_c0_g1_i1.p1  ORF type:complete len:198 (+),score=66.56 TRINITY_DN7645_c0_g1_i1:167-760(+)